MLRFSKSLQVEWRLKAYSDEVTMPDIGQGHPDGLVGAIERGIGGFVKLSSLIDRKTVPVANIPGNN